MMHKIFNDAGYKLTSSFVETDQFKKLLYASPNFLFNNSANRMQTNSYIGNFKDNSSCSATQANFKIFDETTNVGANVANQSGLLYIVQCHPPIRIGYDPFVKEPPLIELLLACMGVFKPVNCVLISMLIRPVNHPVNCPVDLRIQLTFPMFSKDP